MGAVGVTLVVAYPATYPEVPAEVRRRQACSCCQAGWVGGCPHPRLTALQIELTVDKGLTESQGDTLRELIKSTVCSLVAVRHCRTPCDANLWPSRRTKWSASRACSMCRKP